MKCNVKYVLAFQAGKVQVHSCVTCPIPPTSVWLEASFCIHSKSCHNGKYVSGCLNKILNFLSLTKPKNHLQAKDRWWLSALPVD